MKRSGKIIVAVIVVLVMLAVVINLRYGMAVAAADPEVQVETVYVDRPVTEYVYIESEPAQPVYFAEIANTITQEEIDLLAKIVYLEAGNQSLLGQRAVVSVILNRVMDDAFPNTIEDVIYQKNPIQFTSVSKLNSATPNETQYEAIRLTLEETAPIIPSDVLYFSTGSTGREIYEKIGAHYFCR